MSESDIIPGVFGIVTAGSIGLLLTATYYAVKHIDSQRHPDVQMLYNTIDQLIQTPALNKNFSNNYKNLNNKLDLPNNYMSDSDNTIY